MTTKTMAAVLAAHLLDCVMYIGTGQEYLCICGNRASSHDAHQEEMLAGAGFGDVRAAGAKALEDAADRFEQRSETLHATMQNMVGLREYTHEDIIRYGAYSAEANTTDHWLRARAAAVRGEG